MLAVVNLELDADTICAAYNDMVIASGETSLGTLGDTVRVYVVI